MNSSRKIKTKHMVLCSIFTALIIIGAFIKVPLPIVPVTLQIVFTNLSGLILGANLGALSVIVYIVLGLAGVPVFTSGGGIAYILRPTFGYLIGFVIGTYVAGKIVENKEEVSIKRYIIASLANLAIVYAIGVVYMYFMQNVYLGAELSIFNAIKMGMIIPFPGNAFLIIISILVLKRVYPAIKNYLK